MPYRYGIRYGEMSRDEIPSAVNLLLSFWLVSSAAFVPYLYAAERYLAIGAGLVIGVVSVVRLAFPSKAQRLGSLSLISGLALTLSALWFRSPSSSFWNLFGIGCLVVSMSIFSVIGPAEKTQ